MATDDYRRRGFMSDNNMKDKIDQFAICRDFLRNVCKRDHCKFYHPKLMDKREAYVFCHDFQNGDCVRVGCRFVHCTVKEEEYFYKHGRLLPHVHQAYKRTMDQLQEENYSICLDYINGKCIRENCKFRHITSIDLPAVSAGATTSSSSIENGGKRKNNFNNCNSHACNNCVCNNDRTAQNNHCCESEEFYNTVKRRCCHVGNGSSNIEMSHDINDNHRRTIWLLENENEMLRQRVMEFKKKIDELGATNEFLLDQNARLRISGKGTSNLTTVTVPTVTITNTASLQHQGQMPQPPQVMNALRTVAASMATVPVSLAAVATTPVSIATVSIAPVQIPPVVTVAQAPDDGHPGLTANLSNESQSLVSYPILNGSTLLQSAMQQAQDYQNLTSC